jgi:magnesium transporter
MVVRASGPARVEEAGKYAVMARTGLPARDLRVLDPLLSYPSTILGRERAIVVNLERVKAVITAAEVLLPNSKDPAFARFVRDLQTRVLASSSDQVAFSTPSLVVRLSSSQMFSFQSCKLLGIVV